MWSKNENKSWNKKGKWKTLQYPLYHQDKMKALHALLFIRSEFVENEGLTE